MNPIADPAAAPLQCAFAIPAPSAAADSFMYMPGGVHRITPSQGGRPVEIQIEVGPPAAAELNSQLAAINTRPGSRKKAFFDFDHENGPASFWPSRFEWREAPERGVYVVGKWTASGRAAVEGQDYRGFSPVFFVDDTKAKPARIACRPEAGPNMGGLVNDPAFAAIQPFFAHEARRSTPVAGHQNKMKTASTTTAPAATASEDHTTDPLVLAQELEEVRARNAELEVQARQHAEHQADTAIRAAIAGGVIAPLDNATIAGWRNLIIANPSNAALLAKIPGKPYLTERITSNPSRSASIHAFNRGASSPANGGRVQIVAESPVDIINAYEAIFAKQRGEGITFDDKRALALEAGQIYCSAIKNDPRIFDLPLMAVNSLGTLAGILVTQRTLELLKFTFPALSSIWNDFSDEPVKFGVAITTRIITPPTVGTYNTTTGYAQTDDTSADVSVTINRHKYVQSSFGANVLGGTVRNLFQDFAPANAYSIAKEMVDFAFGLILAANFTNAAEVAALPDFDRTTVVDMGTQLTLRGVPQGSANRTLLLHPTYYGRLTSESGVGLNAITALAAFSRPEIITEGVLPELDGFKVFNTGNLPDNSEHLVGFGFSRSALVIAARLPSDYTKILPGASFGNVQVVTNPDSGMSVMQTEYVNHDLGTANQRLAWMYGASPGQNDAGQRLTSQ